MNTAEPNTADDVEDHRRPGLSPRRELIWLAVWLICLAIAALQPPALAAGPAAAPSGPIAITPALTVSGPPGRIAAPTATPTPRASASLSPGITPEVVRAKIQIVWPHDGAAVRDADLANITVYLLAGDGRTPAAAMDSPPCDWRPTVRLWAALNAQPAAMTAVGQKRLVTAGGRTFPAWDFNDINISAARDPANKLTFFITVDGVRTLSNIWTHAADARTLFPQQDMPISTVRSRPAAVDARIQIVWPHDNLPVNQAELANITAFLFSTGTLRAFAPDVAWAPTVRLHWTLNNEPEAASGSSVAGACRIATTAGGIKYLAWDFNDVDISPARDSLNKIFFWVSVDGVRTYSNVWTHGTDARTIFPQTDVLNSCR